MCKLCVSFFRQMKGACEPCFTSVRLLPMLDERWLLQKRKSYLARVKREATSFFSFFLCCGYLFVVSGLEAESKPSTSAIFSLPSIVPMSSLDRGDSAVNAKLIQIKPSLLLQKALRAYSEQLYSKTAELLQQYFQAGGEGAYIRSIYSLTLSHLGLFTRALQEIKTARRLEPKEINYVIIQTELIKKHKSSKQALRFINKFQYGFPQEASLIFSLGELKYELGQYKEALLHYLQTLFQLTPTTRYGLPFRKISLWRVVQIYFQAKEYKKAEKYLIEYIEMSEENAYARFLLADFIYFRSGRYEQALTELESLWQYDRAELIQTSPSYQYISTRITTLLLQLYYFFEDSQFYSLVAFSDKKPALAQEALVHARQWSDSSSLALLQEATKKHPDSYILQTAMVRVMKKLSIGDRVYLEQLLSLGNLALYYGRYREGLEKMKEASQCLDSQTQSLNPLKHSGKIYEQENGDSVPNQKEHSSTDRIYFLRQIYLLYAGYYKFYKQYHRSALYMKKMIDVSSQIEAKGNFPKKWKDAQFSYVRFLGHFDPERALHYIDFLDRDERYKKQTLILRAEIRLAQGQYRQALDAFDRAINEKKNNMRYYLLRAYTHLQLQNYNSVHKDLERVMQSKVPCLEACNLKAYAFAEENKQLDQALELILPLIAQHPTNGAYQDTLGWIYLKRKDYLRARYHLELAVKLLQLSGNPIAEVLEHLGDLYQGIHEMSQGIIAYKGAMAIIESHMSSLKKKRRVGDEGADPQSQKQAKYQYYHKKQQRIQAKLRVLR